jgi:hypothetical protein
MPGFHLIGNNPLDEVYLDTAQEIGSGTLPEPAGKDACATWRSRPGCGFTGLPSPVFLPAVFTFGGCVTYASIHISPNFFFPWLGVVGAFTVAVERPLNEYVRPICPLLSRDFRVPRDKPSR